MESSNKEDYEAKDKAFYAAMIGAWLNTRLERDKQLLGLSVTAIGLLVTLLRTVGVTNLLQAIFFGCALCAFLITVISVIYIFDENSEHIEKILNSSEDESRTLACLDKIAWCSFIMGMILVVLIGIHSAIISLNGKETSMSQEKLSDTHRQSVTNNDSWNGIAKLRPQPPQSAQSKPNTTSNATSPSESSGGNESRNTGESNGGS